MLTKLEITIQQKQSFLTDGATSNTDRDFKNY